MKFLKDNALSLFIGGATLIITYTTTTTMYGYRIGTLETHATQVDQQIATLNTGSVTTQVALAKIQVDLSYIKAQLTELNSK